MIRRLRVWCTENADFTDTRLRVNANAITRFDVRGPRMPVQLTMKSRSEYRLNAVIALLRIGASR